MWATTGASELIQLVTSKVQVKLALYTHVSGYMHVHSYVSECSYLLQILIIYLTRC